MYVYKLSKRLRKCDRPIPDYSPASNFEYENFIEFELSSLTEPTDDPSTELDELHAEAPSSEKVPGSHGAQARAPLWFVNVPVALEGVYGGRVNVEIVENHDYRKNLQFIL